MATKETREAKLVIDGKEAAKSLKELDAEARKFKRILRSLKPDQENYNEVLEATKKKQEANRKAIEAAKQELGLTRKAVKKVDDSASKLGNTFKNITKAAFWIALIQQVYELAKAFVSMTTEVNEARKEVSRLTGETGAQLDILTAKVIALSRTFDVEITKVAKANQALTKSFGGDAEKNLDSLSKLLIVFGKNADEALDQVSEYSSTLSDAGISQEQFFNILALQEQSGAYNDFLIDAVKETNNFSKNTDELTKKLKDVQKNTGNAFNTDALINGLEEGSKKPFEIIQSVLEELQKLPPESQAVRSSLVTLFGTKGEDNSAQTLLALADVSDSMDGLIDKTNVYQQEQLELIESEEDLALAQAEVTKTFEGSGSVFQILANKGLAKVFEFVAELIEKGGEISDTFRTFFAEVEELGKALGVFADSGDVASGVISVFHFLLKGLLVPVRIVLKLTTAWANGLKYLYDNFEVVKNFVDGFIDGLKNYASGVQGVIDLYDRIITSDEELKKRANAQKARQKKARQETVKDTKKAEAEILAEKEKSQKTEAKTVQKNQKAISQAYRDELKKRAENNEKAQREITAKKIELIEEDTERSIAKIREQTKLEKAENQKRQAKGEITSKQRLELNVLIDQDAERQIQEIQDTRLNIERAAQAELKVIQASSNRERVEAELEQLRLKNQKELNDVNTTEAEKAVIRADFAKTEREKLAQLRIDELEAEKNFEIEKAKLRAQEAGINLESAQASGDETATQEAGQNKLNADLEILRLENELKNQILEEQFQAELISKTEFENEKFLIAEEARLREAEADAKAKADAVQRAEELAEQEKAVQDAKHEFIGSVIRGGIDLLSLDEKARKKNANIIKTVAIGEVLFNLQKEIAGYMASAASTASLGTIGSLKSAAATVRALVSIAKIKAQKYEQGGYLRGPSHTFGGIRGTGRFSNIEVEGGEFITNKRATYNNLPVLEAINTFGDKVDFGRILNFETGGQLPDTTPSATVVENIVPDNSVMIMMLIQTQQEQNERMNNWVQNFSVSLNYNDVEEAGTKKSEIQNY